MKLYDIRINNIKEPIGFNFSKIYLSMKIDDIKILEGIDINVYQEKELIYQLKDLKEYRKLLIDIKLNKRTRYDINIILRADNKKITKNTYFITGKLDEELLANWISIKGSDLPLFYKDININKNIKKAFLHISALGIYEAFINKKRIGNEYLTPYLTNYHKEVQLITYEISDYLNKEHNLLEVSVAPGWYMGHYGGPGSEKMFGDQVALYLELHIEYDDGMTDIIKSDESFKARSSEITFSDIYDGELQDYKKEPIEEKIELYHKDINIIPRISLPLLIKEQLKVKELIITKKNEYVLDFGQNHSGFVSFYLEDEDEICLDYGEILQDGCFYNDNYRSAKATFKVKCKKERTYYYAHHTYFGYRYVRISGLKHPIILDDFISNVLYSDIDQTGYFECGRKDLNRLFLNSIWGLKSNFLDMPTDCPQRDERLGWTGDAQVFSHTASLHMSTLAFYDKFLHDLRIYQLTLDGGVPSCIPEIFHHHDFTAVWSDAATIIPMNLYEIYGDLSIIEKYYPLMKDWVDFVYRLIKKNNQNNLLWNFGFQYGDWLALDGESEISSFGGTDTSFIASIYYYNSLNLVIKAASLLNKEEDIKKYQLIVDVLKQDILNNYYIDGKFKLDTQTAYVISLKYGVYINKEEIIRHFKMRLMKDNYYLKTGFVGTPLLLSTLADNGMEDIAVRILLNEDFPSWLYAIKLGATTIWERWNSVLSDGRISDTGMNSLNHYSYGSVASFMYEYLAGIRIKEVGYKEVLFKPIFVRSLNYVSSSIDSNYGLIKSSYKFINDDTVYVCFRVPYGVKGIIELENYNKTIIIEKEKYELIYKLK